VLRTSNNRAQQKKMMFLERNLEQLTVVQRQLVEQNSSLKKEVAIAERKLIARNERIQSLESLLQDSQEKLTAANHRYIYHDRRLLQALADKTQIRSPTYSRKRASRGRQGWLDTWSRLTFRARRIVRFWRRCRLTYRQTSSRRRRRPRRTCTSSHRQLAEAGR
jgi:phage-related minor tail protein